MIAKGVCLFLEEKQTCSALRYYDQRMIIRIIELMKRTDAIFDMLYLCIIYVLQRYNNKMQPRILAKVTRYMVDCKNYSSSLCQNFELVDEKVEGILQRLQDPGEKEDELGFFKMQ